MDDYTRYDRVLQHIAEGHEPSKLEEELMERWECVVNTRKPHVKTEAQVSTFIFHFTIFVCENGMNGFCVGQEGGSNKESSRGSSSSESSSKGSSTEKEESSSRGSSSSESSSKGSSSSSGTEKEESTAEAEAQKKRKAATEEATVAKEAAAAKKADRYVFLKKKQTAEGQLRGAESKELKKLHDAKIQTKRRKED